MRIAAVLTGEASDRSPPFGFCGLPTSPVASYSQWCRRSILPSGGGRAALQFEAGVQIAAAACRHRESCTTGLK